MAPRRREKGAGGSSKSSPPSCCRWRFGDTSLSTIEGTTLLLHYLVSAGIKPTWLHSPGKLGTERLGGLATPGQPPQPSLEGCPLWARLQWPWLQRGKGQTQSCQQGQKPWVLRRPHRSPCLMPGLFIKMQCWQAHIPVWQWARSPDSSILLEAQSCTPTALEPLHGGPLLRLLHVCFSSSQPQFLTASWCCPEEAWFH